MGRTQFNFVPPVSALNTGHSIEPCGREEALKALSGVEKAL